MIISIITYFLFAFVMSRLGSLKHRQDTLRVLKKDNYCFFSPEMVLLLLFFAVMCGIRYNVGVDHLAYKYLYEHISRLESVDTTKEFLFWGIVKGMNILGLHYVFFFALLALMQIVFIYYALRKEQYLFVFLPWVLIFGQYYLIWMNGIRQMIVASVFVYSIELIVNKKMWKYLVLIYICSFIHKSALLLLPLYFLPNKDYFKNRWITIALVLGSVIISQTTVFFQNDPSFNNLLTFLGYEEYGSRIDIIIEDISASVLGIRHLSILITNLLIIYFSPKLKAKFKAKTFHFYYNLFVIFAITYELFPQSSVLARPFLYLINFAMIMTAYLLYYLYSNIKTLYSKSFIVYVAAITIVIIFNIYNNIEVFGIEGESVLFKFFWNCN